MLEVKGLTKHFGGLQAICDVNLEVRTGEIVGIIGPNGAGKTTFFNLISGVLKPTRGAVHFESLNITAKKPHAIAGLGVVRTFQGNTIFPDFSVRDNLILSCHLEPGVGAFETILRTRSSRRKNKEISDGTDSILELVGLKEMANITARNLAHGHKRLLGIAIALAARPKLLLLDEPLGGMNGEEVTQTMEIISRLWKQGITILLIEHNMRATMNLCQRIIVLNFGRKIAEGTPDDIKTNADVIQAYLGTGANA